VIERQIEAIRGTGRLVPGKRVVHDRDRGEITVYGINLVCTHSQLCAAIVRLYWELLSWGGDGEADSKTRVVANE